LKEIDVPGKRKVSSYSRPEQGIGIACRHWTQQGLHPACRFSQNPVRITVGCHAT
jgi:hypothetical protein